MSHFALVHGSMHGGWCWRDLVPELEALGHTASAPSLPCDDPAAGLDVYAETVEREIRDREDVILVGHSLGGRTLPVVATRRPVQRMIFLCCAPTGPGPIDPAAFTAMVTEDFADAAYEECSDGSRRMLPESALSVFFHDCTPETARWAASQLRFQGPLPLREPAPFEAWPGVPLDVILTRDDRAMRPEWVIPEARRWLDGREPIQLAGSHSPFLSRPGELARVLVGCTTSP